MDPNETLKQMLWLSCRIATLWDVDEVPDSEQIASCATELSEHVAALDGWLSKGGFLPDAWKR